MGEIRETLRSNIEKYISASGLTQKEIAERLGVSKSSITNWIKGKNSPDVDLIEPLCSILGITFSQLYGMEEKEARPMPPNIMPLPHFVKRPRLGTIACGRPIFCVEEADEYDDVPDDIECDFTLLCRGDSMINARIFDGDIVYIHAQPIVENGEIAAVRIGDEATLKKVYYTPGCSRITLRAANPLYADMEYEGPTLDEIEIMGKAIAFTSKIR